MLFVFFFFSCGYETQKEQLKFLICLSTGERETIRMGSDIKIKKFKAGVSSMAEHYEIFYFVNYF